MIKIYVGSGGIFPCTNHMFKKLSALTKNKKVKIFIRIIFTTTPMAI